MAWGSADRERVVAKQSLSARLRKSNRLSIGLRDCIDISLHTGKPRHVGTAIHYPAAKR
jgi:hypothetical protein